MYKYSIIFILNKTKKFFSESASINPHAKHYFLQCTLDIVELSVVGVTLNVFIPEVVINVLDLLSLTTELQWLSRDLDKLAPTQLCVPVQLTLIHGKKPAYNNLW